MEEVWRTIPSYDGFYAASNLGRVKSFDRFVPCRGENTRKTKGKILKPYINSNGYPYVGLHIKTSRRLYPIHQLVLLAFVGMPPSGTEGAHDDGNPLNNRLSNLAYKTSTQNQADRVRHGTSNRGERCGSAKLTEKKVQEIRKRYIPRSRIDGTHALSREFEVCQQEISLIVQRKRWAHV